MTEPDGVTAKPATRPLVVAAQLLAAAGGLVGFGASVFGLKGDSPWLLLPLCLWTAAPIPLAWWIGSKIARTKPSLVVVVAGLATALALSIFIYWDAYVFGGLWQGLWVMLIVFPPIQTAGLVVILVLAGFLPEGSAGAARGPKIPPN